MKEKNKLIITIIVITLIAVVIVGATYAYWSWTTSAEQKTNVTFTVTSGFSCGADGGETITSQQKILAPTTCTNENYAFQRTITTNVTNNRDSSVYMDLYLKVNQIGTGLTNSQNFKYALTRQANDCTSNVVSQGTFNGVTDNGKVYLFRGSEYPTTYSDTYYLYVWLDAAETDSATQNQTFNISLGGECTDNSPYVYTVNLHDESVTNNNEVIIGSQISNTITQYSTPEAAITALETAYSNANSGATASLPFYLKHTVGDYSGWCIIMNNDTSNCLYNAPTESECNTVLSQGAPDDGNTYTCSNITASNVVTESYVGFVVTPAMATAIPGMVAGTYYLKGGDNGASFVDNAKTIYDAFGGVRCYLDGNLGGNPYTTTPSSFFHCRVSGLNAYAGSGGLVVADDRAGSRCEVVDDGLSDCRVNEDGGE